MDESPPDPEEVQPAHPPPTPVPAPAAAQPAKPDATYLQMLQAAITRMAGNAFLAKGWSITLTTATLGLTVKDGGPAFALIGLVPVALFACIDTYYLALEKGFRNLFTTAAAAYNAGEPPSFVMSPGEVDGDKFRQAMQSPSVWGVHGPLAVALLLAWLWVIFR